MTDPYLDLRRFPVQKTVEPQPIGRVLSELIALKGLARVHGVEQLHKAWRTVAGEEIGRQTRVLEMSRGVLQVGVSNSAVLSELAGFHKEKLLRSLQEQFADLKIRDIKFKRKTDLK